ncbi:MAG: AAA family ATPase [Acutalibacteraceae bacterium]|nr:AAA family ATPase [Acutalibacteraceae bacterium]
MTKTIAVTYAKGGIGKTTTTISLGFDLALRGYKILLIDFDYNSSLSQYFAINTDASEISDYTLNQPNTIFEVMTGKCKPHEAITNIKFPKRSRIGYTPENIVYDVIPCSQAFMLIPDIIATKTLRAEYLLKDAIKELVQSNYYDFILFDCPPSGGRLKMNILVASDYVLFPCSPSIMSLRNLVDACQEIIDIKSTSNPSITEIGIFLTGMANKKEHKRCEEEIENQDMIPVLNTRISNCSAPFAEASDVLAPVGYARSTSKPAIQYHQLGDEILNKLGFKLTK